jgi:hypothetical protein
MGNANILNTPAMRTTMFVALGMIFNSSFSQDIPEKTFQSEVDEVTVFLKGAQVVRKKAVEVPGGAHILKFVNLSPFIEAKSIQVKADGEITVLSVNHQQNFLDKSEKSEELKSLEKQLETISDQITEENTKLVILQEELAFLRDNRNIGGKNDQVNITSLQQASEFYGKKLTTLKMNEIEVNKYLRELNKKRNDLQNQINSLAGKREFPTGEILVKVDAVRSGTFPIELSYLVGNAGWFPSYDIRAENIDEPVQLVYKANVKQDTKVDWNDVNIRFSSANPNVSGIAPELKTYYLNYNTAPPTYNLSLNSVRGRVTDQQGQPLPGANVMVAGSTVGTVTDLGGNYSLTIPNNASQLTISYVGYNSQTLPINREVMNVSLQENVMALEEVVVNATGRAEPRAMKSMTVTVADESATGIRGGSSLPVPTAQKLNQTSVDFEISTPYTVKSDNRNYTVDMELYELPAMYQYYSVPKIDKDAFLIAGIVDWEKYNLLEGEANVFFEDTYVGKTLLDVRYASDTLEISLGRDKQISVDRQKIRDFTTRQFIGNRKEETRAWKTTVKNNKNQEISMIVLDQVPVSTLEEIEVNVQTTSGGKRDPETGEIEWEFSLEPSDTRELELKYSVKYPKNRTLIVE